MSAPVPSPFQGEGWPTGRGEDVNEGWPLRQGEFYKDGKYGNIYNHRK